jgi:hypothetical protein
MLNAILRGIRFVILVLGIWKNSAGMWPPIGGDGASATLALPAGSGTVSGAADTTHVVFEPG